LPLCLNSVCIHNLLIFRKFATHEVINNLQSIHSAKLTPLIICILIIRILII
jgi:hypothetical protein